MFTSVGNRSANAYKRVSVETSVDGANPHHLVVLLFDALQVALGSAKLAMERRDVVSKVKHIGHAIRILEEGLKVPLDLENGGEVAKNLDTLYGYCLKRLMLANAKNDLGMLDEVSGLIAPVADGWKRIDGKGPAYLKPV